MKDFQLDNRGRQFHLAIIEDPETGYLYDGPIIKETTEMSDINLIGTIKSFISDYKNKKLIPYLRTEPIPIDDPDKSIKSVVG